MLDAMDAFKKVSAAARLPIILLFTKIDVFEDLLSIHSFTDFFPEYSGSMKSSKIYAYLVSRFRQLHLGSNKKLFIRVVDAAEPEAFRKIFGEIESEILNPRPRSTANASSDKFLHVKSSSSPDEYAQSLAEYPNNPEMDRQFLAYYDDNDDDDDDDDDDSSLNFYDAHNEEWPLSNDFGNDDNDNDDGSIQTTNTDPVEKIAKAVVLRRSNESVQILDLDSNSNRNDRPMGIL